MANTLKDRGRRTDYTIRQAHLAQREKFLGPHAALAAELAGGTLSLVDLNQ